MNRDYVVCTGESHSLQTLIEKVFEELELNWVDHVKISEELFRSNEIETSMGNPNSIHKDLGWKSEIKISELVRKIIDHTINTENSN